jgi:glycosyltransferase involved in cell wall biosynthesis
MRIALIGRFSEGEIISGPERVARELYSELIKNNLQVVFIEYFFSGYKNSSVSKKLFGREFHNNNSIMRLGIFPLLLFLIKEKFEVIHIVNIQRFILILFLVKPVIKSKLIATLHGFLKYENPKKNYWTKRYFLDFRVERLIIKKCRILIFPSKLLFQTFSQNYKITPENYRIIPNAVSNLFYNQITNFPPVANSIKLVFYNGLTESINKGIDELLKLLNNVIVKIELYVIGKKSELEVIDNVKVINVEPKCPEDLIHFLRDKHFIIKSSAFDTFSLFVAECMLLGLIPIINENIGIKDFVEHGVNGFLYDYSTSDGLANLLNDIYKDKYDLNLISNNARKIYDQLNWQNITRKYIDVYKSVL